MKNEANLFSHLSKELSVDSFLMWLFHFINVDEKLLAGRDTFIEALILKPEDYGKSVSDLHARRKDRKWERESDIVLDFKLNGEPKTVLFEAQIVPLTTLRGYRNTYPNLYANVYLQMNKASYQEHKLAEKHGCLVGDLDLLLAALTPLAKFSSIIEHYCQYLLSQHKNAARDSSFNRHNPNSDDFYRLRSKYLRFA